MGLSVISHQPFRPAWSGGTATPLHRDRSNNDHWPAFPASARLRGGCWPSSHLRLWPSFRSAVGREAVTASALIGFTTPERRLDEGCHGLRSDRLVQNLAAHRLDPGLDLRAEVTGDHTD